MPRTHLLYTLFTLHRVVQRQEADVAHWWIPLLHGFVGIGLGAITPFNPAITALALLVYSAMWAIVVGVLQVVAAIKLRHELTGDRRLCELSGDSRS